MADLDTDAVRTFIRENLAWLVPVGFIAVRFIFAGLMTVGATEHRRGEYLREHWRALPVELTQLGLVLLWVDALLAVANLNTSGLIRTALAVASLVILLPTIMFAHFATEETFGRWLWRLWLPLFVSLMFLIYIVQLSASGR